MSRVVIFSENEMRGAARFILSNFRDLPEDQFELAVLSHFFEKLVFHDLSSEVGLQYAESLAQFLKTARQVRVDERERGP